MKAEILHLFPEAAELDKLSRICENGRFEGRCVAFCMTARVGSTVLMDLMSNNAGFPYIEEVFNGRDVVPTLMKDHKLSTLEAYLAFLKSFHTTQIFSFKTNWIDFNWLVENENWRKLFPNMHFIYLDRLDVEAQAVSLFTAMNSGLWHRRGDDWGDRKPVAYNKLEIDKIVWELTADKRQWWNFFSCENICPTTIVYEGIKRSPRAAIARIYADLGMPTDNIPDYSKSEVKPSVTNEQLDILTQYRKDRYPGIFIE